MLTEAELAELEELIERDLWHAVGECEACDEARDRLSDAAPPLVAEVRRLRASDWVWRTVYAELEQALAHEELPAHERTRYERWYEQGMLGFAGQAPPPREAGG